MILKDKLFEKIQEHRPRTVRLLKEHGDVKLCDVTIAQAIGGARGVRCLVTDVSYLDPFEGIRFRGMTIPATFGFLAYEFPRRMGVPSRIAPSLPRTRTA